MHKAYGKYKGVRNESWQALIDNKITTLPVDVAKIAENNDIILLKNSTEKVLKPNESGTSILDNKDWFIIYDDSIVCKNRRRFVVAHELGHIFLGHPLRVEAHSDTKSTKLPSSERDANRFAIRFLCPACVLWGLNLSSAKDIAKICGISDNEADIRAKRMKELYKRDKFLTETLEQQLFTQFEKFIKR
jgi:Zn-dependent peptidase ImmA (M78 family)